MDRGPVALFGAIVAIGLGPAMWLGAQFGSIEVAPTRPPATVGEHTSGPDSLLGGAGAGERDGPADDTVIRSTPRANQQPLTSSPSASPSPSDPSPIGDTTSATPSTSGGPSESTGPTTPPTESTTEPTTPPTGGTGTTAPPDPPSSDRDSGSGGYIDHDADDIAGRTIEG